MDARPLAVAVVVLLSLVVGAQLAFTTVGQPVGEQWSSPTSVASMAASDDRGVIEVASAGDGERGAVAWLSRSGGRYVVSVAAVTVHDGEVSVGPSRTVASGPRALQGLDVAVDGESIVLVWERTLENDVVLYRDGEARVVSDDPLRAAEPSVALTGGGAVVAWQEWSGSGFDVQVAGVSDGSVVYRRLDVETGGPGSPALGATADGFAVTWFDAGSRTTRTAYGRLEPTGLILDEPRVVGEARPSGGFGGSTGPVAVDAATDGAVVRAVWEDIATLTTAEVARTGGGSEPIELGRGDRPRIAAADGRWLAAWVVAGRAADNDLLFATADDRGTLSRFPSSANHPSPFFAPDGAVAWSERGESSRVLVSGLDPNRGGEYLTRLSSEPGRLAFIALAAAALGVVTLPVMPWVFVMMLVAFYLSNRFFRDRAAGMVAWVSNLGGAGTDGRAVRERFEEAPPTAWAALFALGEVAILVSLLPSVGPSVSLTFSGPVPLSVGAAVGTLIVQRVAPQRSPWRVIAIFAYLQTAALWATALPDVL